MAHLDPLRKLKENNKKVRIMVSLSRMAYEAILRLNQQEPDKDASTIISESLRFAEQMDIYQPLRERLQMLQSQVGATPVKNLKYPREIRRRGRRIGVSYMGGHVTGLIAGS